MLPPQNSECEKLCLGCFSDANGFSQDSVCLKVEANCKCKDYALQELTQLQKKENDSIADIKRFEAAKVIVDSVYSLCDTIKKCEVQVTFLGKEMLVADMRLVKSAGLENSVNQPLNKMDSKVIAPSSNSLNKVDSNDVDYSSNENKSTQDDFIIKKGLGLYIGSFRQFNDMSSIFGLDLSEDGFEGGFEGIIKLYFKSFVSIQLGLGANYHYVEYFGVGNGSAHVNYSFHNVSLDVPIDIRIGPSYKGFRPFIGYEWDIRKPIYCWRVLDYTYDTVVADDAYEEADFELVTRLNLGIDLNYNVSLVYQIMLESHTAADGHEYDENYRFKIQILW